jgi:hypothetical protein
MLSLLEVVERYGKLAGKFGEPVALADFGLTAEETTKLFSAFDEDYHISRFFDFSVRGGERYLINGSAVTHISIDSGIQDVL